MTIEADISLSQLSSEEFRLFYSMKVPYHKVLDPWARTESMT